MTATKNGKGDQNKCATMGHDWELAPEKSLGGRVGHPAEFKCSRCPAIGGTCPKTGNPADDCARCHGTGVVELVEISLDEVATLRIAAKRFKFMIQIFAQANGMSRADAIAELDELIAGQQDFTAWANSLPIPNAERKKKPPAVARTTEGSGAVTAVRTTGDAD
jgi:hypothetical protein